MYTANVDGMTCGHCARALTRAIQQRDPEAIVQVDLPKKQVKIAGDLSEQDIRAAIVDAGFEPGVIQQP
ncbi:heavy-metal-associated domain-containing protein [Permianibacter sp. IMCC34836]|uniref:heavy-metal-associated domain-containing protein n=1 Tax=Permianibacter fluminis TaxID=2738515 RepID=UPI001557117E|nr:heavy-metal-associated domain-containing protein [Permianibacter fluminis]NQD36644.1 heavy-metal-associated domain-containing protein [Permianibacter fluminis]